MTRFLWATLLIAGCAQAQVAAPPTSPAASDAAPPKAAAADSLFPARELGGKVSLVRGVLKRLDPIHDQLLIHVFGGGNLRIAFDGRTQLISENAHADVISIPVGSVVSVDTVIDGGKLFARSVRTGPSNAVELNGQVVRYDEGRSQLTLRDPMSPQNISLRITSSTTVINRGQPASPQALSPGMLVRVQLSPARNVAKNVEILAERGSSFTFEGRIVSVDLRSRVLAVSSDSDQSVHELAINSLDKASLGLLREGAEVSIQAEFDGDRYNARTVTLESRNP
ncbi:MAG: hypothetical protein ABSF72_00120 [Candidatus Sulfotelmatobacter sp.]|jgi:hypothetical protein